MAPPMPLLASERCWPSPLFPLKFYDRQARRTAMRRHSISQPVARGGPRESWRLANPLSRKKSGTQAVMALNHLSGQDKQLQQESQKTSGTNERHLADYRSGTARIFSISNFSAQSGLPFDYFSLSRPTLRVEVLESLLRRNRHALICM